MSRLARDVMSRAWGVLGDLREPLTKLVKRKHLVDLGAGNLYIAEQLIEMGAESVLAIEPDQAMAGMTGEEITNAHIALGGSSKITIFPYSYMQCVPILSKPIDLALLSWPANYAAPGLLTLLDRIRTVMYLGRNDESTTCGWEDLHRHLLSRELIEHHDYGPNDLLVYGKRLGQMSEPRCTEEKGMKKFIGYMEEVHRDRSIKR